MVEDQGYFAADAEFQAELERLRAMEAMSDPLGSSMWLTMSERLDDYLVTEGILSQIEVDATRGALTDPSFWLRNGMTISAWGRRSG
jgi:hypothetical protein